MVDQSSYDLCEQENSNLRRHLAWAAQFLSVEQRSKLAGMIRGPIEDGGVVEDAEEDQVKMLIEIKRLCVKAAELLREPASADGRLLNATLQRHHWFARAEDLANRLMEFDPPTPKANLHELRNTEEMLRKAGLE